MTRCRALTRSRRRADRTAATCAAARGHRGATSATRAVRRARQSGDATAADPGGGTPLDRLQQILRDAAARDGG